MNEIVKNPIERMSCMEIWGGNRAIEKCFAAPGIDIYVQSQPFQDSKSGGDIYYLTSCASGRISRFLLADVAGHGEHASDLAKSLRDLLRDAVNRVSQEKFVADMNREFGQLSEDSSFATAVVATFFEPTRTLDISVAGHPYPFYYQAEKHRWVHLDPASTETHLENMPLGIFEQTNYPRRKITTNVNDMFLLYTDAFVESLTGDDRVRQLGIRGMLELLNENVGLAAHEIIPFLRHQVGGMAKGNLTDDDASLILGHFTETKVRLRDNLMAPIRLLGGVGDRTELD